MGRSQGNYKDGFFGRSGDAGRVTYLNCASGQQWSPTEPDVSTSGVLCSPPLPPPHPTQQPRQKILVRGWSRVGRLGGYPPNWPVR